MDNGEQSVITCLATSTPALSATVSDSGLYCVIAYDYCFLKESVSSRCVETILSTPCLVTTYCMITLAYVELGVNLGLLDDGPSITQQSTFRLICFKSIITSFSSVVYFRSFQFAG